MVDQGRPATIILFSYQLTMKTKHFDLIVLGGGSGGIASAVRAAQYGAKVAVIEQNHLGGTCVNLGCVPKKIMYNASAIAETLHKSPDYGFFLENNAKLDWKRLVNKRNAYIERLRENYEKRFSQHKITLIQGKGIFHDQSSITIDHTIYQAEHIIIATGGEPTLPAINGIKHAIDSDGFFH